MSFIGKKEMKKKDKEIGCTNRLKTLKYFNKIKRQKKNYFDPDQNLNYVYLGSQ